mmetsp:Transcript_724/g.2160  ORF Transcript_724/g.2160 Transcript_724/m.2160 type:complete len:559 (+) Transcript_724:497-2173(+)
MSSSRPPSCTSHQMSMVPSSLSSMDGNESMPLATSRLLFSRRSDLSRSTYATTLLGSRFSGHVSSTVLGLSAPRPAVCTVASTPPTMVSATVTDVKPRTPDALTCADSTASASSASLMACSSMRLPWNTVATIVRPRPSLSCAARWRSFSCTGCPVRDVRVRMMSCGRQFFGCSDVWPSASSAECACCRRSPVPLSPQSPHCRSSLTLLMYLYKARTRTAANSVAGSDTTSMIVRHASAPNSAVDQWKCLKPGRKEGALRMASAKQARLMAVYIERKKMVCGGVMASRLPARHGRDAMNHVSHSSRVGLRDGASLSFFSPSPSSSASAGDAPPSTSAAGPPTPPAPPTPPTPPTPLAAGPGFCTLATLTLLGLRTSRKGTMPSSMMPASSCGAPVRLCSAAPSELMTMPRATMVGCGHDTVDTTSLLALSVSLDTKIAKSHTKAMYSTVVTPMAESVPFGMLRPGSASEPLRLLPAMMPVTDGKKSAISDVNVGTLSPDLSGVNAVNRLGSSARFRALVPPKSTPAPYMLTPTTADTIDAMTTKRNTGATLATNATPP